jgi:DNA mismatch repair protein PMS2
MAGDGGSAQPSAGIKAIDRSTVHRICCGQVVTDLPTAVKELIENALDAGATTIEVAARGPQIAPAPPRGRFGGHLRKRRPAHAAQVRLKEHGSALIEVADNGSGVAPEDYESLALAHATSKLSTFSDLPQLSTFGFRGEALAALAALAEVRRSGAARRRQLLIRPAAA